MYLCGASLSFITSISEKLNNLKFIHSFIRIKPKNCIINGRIIVAKNTMYRLQIGGYKKCVKFLDWLYDGNSISMPRKMALSKDIIFHYKNGGTSRLIGLIR